MVEQSDTLCPVKQSPFLQSLGPRLDGCAFVNFRAAHVVTVGYEQPSFADVDDNY